MKTIRVLPALLLIAFSTSCVPLASIYPLWDQEHLKELPGLEGIWAEGDETMIITKEEDGAYLANYLADKNSSSYELHVVELSGRYYCDFFSQQDALDKRLAGEAYPCIVQAHFFAKMTMDGDLLQIEMLDDERAEAKVGVNDPSAPILKRGSDLLLIADTKALQKLIAGLADDPDVWTDKTVFTRKKQSIEKILCEIPSGDKD